MLFTVAAEFGPEHVLMTHLLDGYDRNARPLHDPSKPINVTMDIAFNQILDLVIL